MSDAVRLPPEPFLEGTAFGLLSFRLADGIILRATAACTRLLDLSAPIESFLGRSITVVGHYPPLTAEERSRLERGTAIHRSYRLATVAEHEVQIAECMVPLKEAPETSPMVEAFLLDISLWKQTISRLEQQAERLDLTIRFLGEGAITTDETSRVADLNPQAEQLTGWRQNEAVARPLGEIFRLFAEETGQPVETPLLHALATKQPTRLSDPVFLLARDGSRHLVAASAAPLFNRDGALQGGVLLFQDVTRARRYREELEKAERLDALGLLASGIAHDFNNILTGIFGYIGLAQVEAAPGTRIADRLGNAEKALTRARQLSDQLLTFAKGRIPTRHPLVLGPLIQETVTALLRGTPLQIEFSLSPDLHQIEGDEPMLTQAVGHLVRNAVEAMPDGGILQVRAENCYLPDHNFLPLPEGHFVRLSIRDQGPGIPRRVLKRIFDPYYTTKKNHMGIGLATAFSIIRNHGGLITVDSEENGGSSFHAYLPVPENMITPAALPVTPAGAGSRGRILVMDDEEIIRQVLSEMLTHLGYEVETVTDGSEAVEHYLHSQNAGKRFDLVVLDLTIPGGMGAKETMQKLLSMDPQVQAVVSSGYSFGPLMSEFHQYGFVGAIAKPYEIKTLRDLLSRLRFR